MKKNFLLLTLIYSSLNVFCQDSIKGKWIYVGSSLTNDKYYIRSDYTEKHDNIVMLWTMAKLKEIKIGQKTFYNVEQRALRSFDCFLKQTIFAQVVYYDAKHRVIKKKIYSDDDEPEESSKWEYPVPDSIDELMLKKVCTLFNN